MKASIILLNFLRFFTTKTFDFILSLSLFMVLPIVTMSFGLAILSLICHFFYFKYVNTFFRKIYKTDDSYNEYTNRINKLNQY